MLVHVLMLPKLDCSTELHRDMLCLILSACIVAKSHSSKMHAHPVSTVTAVQVLRRNYSKEADIWSCGVMLYILLSGMPPFYGDNEQQIFDAVLRNKLDLESDPWPKVSEPAKVRDTAPGLSRIIWWPTG